MDAAQAVRLVEEIELRLAFAGVSEGDGGPAPWPITGVEAPAEASS
jgi:hypothetical protein